MTDTQKPACVSSQGNHDAHDPDDLHVCQRCGMWDKDGLRAEMGRLRAGDLDAAAHKHCLRAIAASPAPEATTAEGIYWLTEKLADLRARLTSAADAWAGGDPDSCARVVEVELRAVLEGGR